MAGSPAPEGQGRADDPDGALATVDQQLQRPAVGDPSSHGRGGDEHLVRTGRPAAGAEGYLAREAAGLGDGEGVEPEVTITDAGPGTARGPREGLAAGELADRGGIHLGRASRAGPGDLASRGLLGAEAVLGVGRLRDPVAVARRDRGLRGPHGQRDRLLRRDRAGRADHEPEADEHRRHADHEQHGERAAPVAAHVPSRQSQGNPPRGEPGRSSR
ncbi:hypothetical protein LP422_24425 [Janibacter limosus]|uniref:hypothetical protein n=1 Tax=Janibacter limosus TaxID=53458 RepID=UPI0035DAC154|nr:hypothetical protein LP422_24425 [Janibacter limosus]